MDVTKGNRWIMVMTWSFTPFLLQMDSSKKSKLPLPFLPFLVFEKIYPDLDFSDIINLASCSRRMENMVFSVTKLAKKDTFCEILINQYSRIITVKREGRKSFIWSSHTERDHRAAGAKVFVDRKMDEVVWTVSPQPTGWIKIGINDEDTIFWVEYLKDLFNCRTSKLSIYIPGNFDFYKLLVQTDVLYMADQIQIESPYLKDCEMTHLLDNLKPRDLILHTVLHPNFAYDKVLGPPAKLIISDASWVSTDNFHHLAQNSRFLELHGMKMNCKEINRMLKDWLNGVNRTLEFLILPHYVETEEFRRRHALQGIDTTQTDLDRPELARFQNTQYSIDWHRGEDIRRADGLEATIVLNSYGYTSACFVVHF